MISSFSIELSGGFLIEIGEYGQLTGSTARNSLLCAIFLLATTLLSRYCLHVLPTTFPRISTLNRYSRNFFLALSTFVTAYLIIIFIIYHPPLLTSLSRFDFMNGYAPPEFRRIYTLIPFVFFIISLAYREKMLKRRTSFLLITALISIMILTGEKFSLIFLSFMFYLMPKFAIDNLTIRLKHLLYFAMLLFLFFLLIIANYYIISGSVAMLAPRLLLQGQMPYALDGIASGFQSLQTITCGLADLCVAQSESGIYYLMYLIAPFEIVNRMQESGVTFTAPFPGNISYFFGRFAAPFFIIPFALLAGFFSALLVRSIQSINWLAVPPALVGYHIVFLAVTMGKTDKLLSPPMLLCTSMILLYGLALVVFHKNIKHRPFS